ncbi:MAG: hypothetical protein ACRDTF_24810 [Pseudonocardiaceae bacterium]
MSDALSFAEIDGQHVELLPARTTLLVAGPVNNALGNLGGDGGGASSSGDASTVGGSSQNPQNNSGAGGGFAQGGGVAGGLLGSLGAQYIGSYSP